MIVKGSMNYATSGRKKKIFKSSRKKPPPFVPLKRERANFRPVWWQEQLTKQASAPFKPYVPRPVEDTSYRQEVSKKYTISIPYNKGAYQVVPSDEVGNIGR